MISRQQIQHMIDQKTKPIGALGQLEQIALQICQVQQTCHPELKNPHMIVFAADHGLATSGVSAYPQEVTSQMVLNFVAGGAAINVFCRQHGLELKIVDAGVATDFDPTLNIVHRKIAKGTRNTLEGPAMTREQLAHCFEQGADLVREARSKGCNIIGFGEMGIGNTSSATLIEHYLLQLPLADCVGRGTGLTEAGLKKKLAVLQEVVQKHGSLDTPQTVLQHVGGFEIAMMTQAIIEAASLGMLVMIDGFIASAAALCACAIQPQTRDNLLFCHQSNEAGHAALLNHLEAHTILKLDMRLGEGSGCALAYPLIQSAVQFVNEMASFESASVSGQSLD